MSNPMSPEKCETSISRREHKRKERKMWKKPIKISGFSGSDQIPIIFSGYTAESEDSSSSSDESRTYSNSSVDDNEEMDQERSRRVSMKILKRQSTRKVSVLKKMRSMKRLTVVRKTKMNLDFEEEPRYLRPTSSSASKNVEKIQKVARLKRINSLRYNGLLKATCSSAMKGSNKSNDVCNYRYCSLHGRRHSHAAAGDSSVVTVPSLKRFVSMRRRFLKRQKSVNRRLVLLKRTLSRKSGPLGGGIVSDQEPKQVDDDDNDDDNDSESNGDEDSMESVVMETKLEIMDGSDGRIDKDLQVDDNADEESYERSTEMVMVDVKDESTPEIMDDSDGRIEKESVEDDEEVCREEDGKNIENVWNDTVALVKQAFDEILAEITDDEDKSDDTSVGEDESGKEDDLSDSSSSDMQTIQKRDTHLSVILSTSYMVEESDHRKGPKKWSFLKRVILLKRFLKSVDRRERRKLCHGEESELMRLRRNLVGERKKSEEWMLDHALRQVISTLDSSQKRKVKHLVKAFESLIPMDGGSDDLGSPEREENGTVNPQTISRDIKDTTDLLEVLPEKDPEETNLTSTEASSSMCIGMELEEALESKADASSIHHLGSPGREENETVNSQTILRDNKDTTDLLEVLPEKHLEETKLTSESSLESKEDVSSSHQHAVEEEIDGLALGKEKKTGDSEQQNLSTWRNLIQKHMDTRDNSERKVDETEQEHKCSYGTDGDAATVESIQQAFEKILAEIPDDIEIASELSNTPNVEKKEQAETKRSWNSLRKVVLLKRFVKSLEKARVLNPRKVRNLPVESALEAENVLLRHRSILERSRTAGEEVMLDYAMRQAISRLAPVQRKKVELLVQAFDTVLDGHETPKQSKTSDTPRNKTPRVEEDCKLNKSPRVEEACEVNKDEQRIKNVFSRFQVQQKDLKGEEEVDSTPKKSRNLLPPIKNVKQRIVVEKEKDSKLWKLIYKHMVTEKEGTDSANGDSVASVEGEYDDEAVSFQNDARSSGTVTLVREALEKILSEIPDNSSDDQSVDSDITTDQELFERNSQVSEELITFKPKRVKGWNNVKKVILLKRFVSDLGSLSRLSPKTPRVLPWEPDPETEKIRLRHQEMGGKRNSEEWMLDYALRQAISTLAPSQKRKVSLLAQAFDTISLQDIGNCSTPGSATTSRNISRQSSVSSMTVHSENEGNNAEILRGRLRNLQEDLKETTKLDGVANDMEEKQQCSGLWRLLCKQMEDNERTQMLPEETTKEEEEDSKEDKDTDSEKMESYQTEAVELLGEVIDGISLEENQDQNLNQGETRSVPLLKVRSNRWSNLKKVILLRRFVKALDNVRKFNPKEPRFLPLNPDAEAEKVNLRHQETQNKRNNEDWMVDNALQGVVSQLTPARRLKVQLLVQAFETLSATGN